MYLPWFARAVVPYEPEHEQIPVLFNYTTHLEVSSCVLHPHNIAAIRVKTPTIMKVAEQFALFIREGIKVWSLHSGMLNFLFW